MAKGHASLTPAATTGLTRRRGRPLNKGERRDVRWALTLRDARGIDVHGVYVAFHQSQSQAQTPKQPTRQPSGTPGKDGEEGRKPRKKVSEAQQAKKDAKWKAKCLKRAFLSAMPVVGAWVRRQRPQSLEASEAAAAVAPAAAHDARVQQLQDEKLALQRELEREQEARVRERDKAARERVQWEKDIKKHATELTRRWRAAAIQANPELAELAPTKPPAAPLPPPGTAPLAPPTDAGASAGAEPMDDERAPKRAHDSSPSQSAAKAGTSYAEAARQSGTPPQAKKTLFRGDAAAEEHRLLTDASDAMAAKGGGRGKG